MNDIFIRVVDLDPRTPGFVKEGTDGDMNIYISVHLSKEQRRRVLLHELMHITRGHLSSKKSVAVLEAEVEKIMEEMRW